VIRAFTFKARLRRSRDRVSWNPTLAAKSAARVPGHAKALRTFNETRLESGIRENGAESWNCPSPLPKARVPLPVLPRAVLHLLMKQTQFNVSPVGRDERTEEYARAG
jgi:hypothetical protein